MQYLGDYRIDDYISFGAQLHRFSSGAVYAPTGNATYTFYENNSTSGAPTGGNLAQLNTKTGLYTVRVQLTAAAGFEAGKEYFIHIEATVDSVAAAELLMFRIITDPNVVANSLGTQAKADINAELVDVMTVDTHAEPGQGAPPATATKLQMLQYLYKNWRNLSKQSATGKELYDDAGTMVDQKTTDSDAAGVYSKGEWVSGP